MPLDNQLDEGAADFRNLPQEVRAVNPVPGARRVRAIRMAI